MEQGDYLVEVDESWLFNKMGFVATQEVLLSFISNVPDYIRKESLPLIFVTSI